MDTKEMDSAINAAKDAEHDDRMTFLCEVMRELADADAIKEASTFLADEHPNQHKVWQKNFWTTTAST